MNPGDIVFQRLSLDPQSVGIAIHSLLTLHKPRFAHCGIYTGEGKMIAACAGGGVQYQDAGAVSNISVPHQWKDWNAAQAFLESQIGKPYDWMAWALCAVEPIGDIFGIEHWQNMGHAYICSALVGCALRRDDPSLTSLLSTRTIAPDDVARILGV